MPPPVAHWVLRHGDGQAKPIGMFGTGTLTSKSDLKLPSDGVFNLFSKQLDFK